MSKKRLTIQTYKKLFDLHEDGYSIEGALSTLDIDFNFILNCQRPLKCQI